MSQLATPAMGPRTTDEPALTPRQLEERRFALITHFLKTFENTGIRTFDREKLHKAFLEFRMGLALRGIHAECLGEVRDGRCIFFEEALEHAEREKLLIEPSRAPGMLALVHGFTQWFNQSHGSLGQNFCKKTKSELHLVMDAAREAVLEYHRLMSPPNQPEAVRIRA